MFFTNQKQFDRWGRFYFAPDGDGSPAPLTDEARAGFESRLNKMSGDATSFATTLYGENFALRKKVQELEPKVTPDGATVLVGDDAKAWAEYQLLGKPADVKTGLDQRTQFQGELVTVKREGLLRRVAEAAKFKYSVLVGRDKEAKIDGKTLVFDVRDVEKDGVKTPTAYVKDGDQTEILLSEYATANWADYLPVLKVEATTTTTQSGTRVIKQHGGSGDGKVETGADVAKGVVAGRYKRPGSKGK